jgi:hypothetical protein
VSPIQTIISEADPARQPAPPGKAERQKRATAVAISGQAFPARIAGIDGPDVGANNVASGDKADLTRMPPSQSTSNIKFQVGYRR